MFLHFLTARSTVHPMLLLVKMQFATTLVVPPRGASNAAVSFLVTPLYFRV